MSQNGAKKQITSCREPEDDDTWPKAIHFHNMRTKRAEKEQQKVPFRERHFLFAKRKDQAILKAPLSLMLCQISRVC